jgi:dephospho-CoA kinase
MKIIGITGGIGSGKSTVCEVFKAFGVPVFHADDEAKKIYKDFPEVLTKVAEWFGQDTVQNGKLNREVLASKVFNDAESLTRLNNLIHPYVTRRFKEWYMDQNGPYVLREAAILIESGSYKDCAEIIVVTAPENVRIARIKKREGNRFEDSLARMKFQMTDEERITYADYVINNDGVELILPQIEVIHHAIRGEIMG